MIMNNKYLNSREIVSKHNQIEKAGLNTLEHRADTDRICWQYSTSWSHYENLCFLLADTEKKNLGGPRVFFKSEDEFGTNSGSITLLGSEKWESIPVGLEMLYQTHWIFHVYLYLYLLHMKLNEMRLIEYFLVSY